MAYNSFSRRFKSITFISTGIYQTHPIRSKVLLIGGGKDGSSSSMPGAYNRLKRNGTKVDKYWQEDEGHFIFINDRKEIVEFLNSNLFEAIKSWGESSHPSPLCRLLGGEIRLYSSTSTVTFMSHTLGLLRERESS